jgi:plasminogen activator inhibitor 1 RNA-binding protein
MKRGGAGKGNWGSSTEAASSGEPKEEKPEGETAETEEKKEEEPEPVIEEEDNEMTLEEFQKADAERKAALKAAYAPKKLDLKEDDELKKMAVVVEKLDESEAVFWIGAGDEKVKGKSKMGEKKEKELVEAGFYIAHEAPPRNFDREAGGRGGGRGDRGGRGGRGRGEGRGAGRGERFGGGRGRGGRSFNAPNLTDSSAFPTLGGA